MGVIVGGVDLGELLSGAVARPDDARSRGEQSVVEAILRCIARWGLAKTTVEDVAREAGVSRATVYRLFPGGKQAILEVAGNHEIARLVLLLHEELPGAEDLEELLVRAISISARFVHTNNALDYLLRHEPEVIAHFIAFDRLDPVFAIAEVFVGPVLDPLTGAVPGAEVAAWLARVLVSYLVLPSPHLNLLDEADVRHLVTTFVLPGIRAADIEPTTTSGSAPVRS